MASRLLFALLGLCLCMVTLAQQQNPAGLVGRPLASRTRPASRDKIRESRSFANARSLSKRDFCPAGPRPSGTTGCKCNTQATCGGFTVDTASDPNNCGSCNNRCGNGQSCASGLCTALPVTFYFRIEGSDSVGTIFEGPITTSPHTVTTPSGGTHQCDGTNSNANPTPGGTATTAIDDAGRFCGFTYDGSYNNQFQDYFITRIGDSAQTGSQFWGILRNKVYTQGGGCQTEGQPGDEILWAFDAFNANSFLALSGPTQVQRGQSYVYTVVGTDGNGSADTPIAGAQVNGQTTDGNGQVVLIFNTPGSYSLKATKPGSIRSNRVDVTIS